ncbi:ATP-binding protein [Leptolyngbya sp. FACHB-261]|uniref:ATP-binding protein n=1 Tax=Leptolyngbya sp. FACHB-261 TaxID=2692806 RepID=UPI001682D602|nr:ATP-binding protein [Leptolyngbya sp. FACHB-261]MBD2099536.1 ATP-binding protein [Leptolyngbya sp. FACHB-261]
MFAQADLEVNSDLHALTQVQEWFEAFCAEQIACEDCGELRQWLGTQVYPLSLALAEGFTNAVRHAHHNLPLSTPVVLQIQLDEKRLAIRIWDYGKPFDPSTLKEPSPGTLQEGGYGWYLLRRLADDLHYIRTDRERNCLEIVKYASPTANSHSSELNG